MDKRLELHNELLKFFKNVYYQPPSNIVMKYPCIVLNKVPGFKNFSNNSRYIKVQAYSLTLIEFDPDSVKANEIEEYFEYCEIDQYYIRDGLNHTTLTLYY